MCGTVVFPVNVHDIRRAGRPDLRRGVCSTMRVSTLFWYYYAPFVVEI
jgi:hypothetical protein